MMVPGLHLFNERLDALLLNKVDGTSPESGSHHAGPEHSRDGGRRVYQEIQIGAADLIFIPESVV